MEGSICNLINLLHVANAENTGKLFFHIFSVSTSVTFEQLRIVGGTLALDPFTTKISSIKTMTQCAIQCYISDGYSLYWYDPETNMCTLVGGDFSFVSPRSSQLAEVYEVNVHPLFVLANFFETSKNITLLMSISSVGLSGRKL